MDVVASCIFMRSVFIIFQRPSECNAVPPGFAGRLGTPGRLVDCRRLRWQTLARMGGESFAKQHVWIIGIFEAQRTSSFCDRCSARRCGRLQTSFWISSGAAAGLSNKIRCFGAVVGHGVLWPGELRSWLSLDKKSILPARGARPCDSPLHLVSPSLRPRFRGLRSLLRQRSPRGR